MVAKKKQDRQCTYNGTLKRFQVNILAMEKQILLHILRVCDFGCVCMRIAFVSPKHKTHARYYIVGVGLSDSIILTCICLMAGVPTAIT